MARKRSGEGEADVVRQANARVAWSYDAVAYDPGGAPHVDPAYVRPLAAMFGLSHRHEDVLDLACGYGAHTERMSRVSRGRIVGLDISAAACERTRARLARAGREADIRCVDVLDVEDEDLGQFDLISCIGTLYIVPQPVRAKMLDLIGKCLRPGGVALISFYAGPSGHVAGEIQRLVRTHLGPVEPSIEASERGRRYIERMIRDFRSLKAEPVVLERAEFMAGLSEEILFHELFGPPLTDLSTRRLQDHLAPYGVQACAFVPYDLAMLGETPDARALSMDILDLMHGGYRYALFGKWPGEPSRADFDTPGIVWSTSYRRWPEGGEHVYRSEDSKIEVTLREPHLRAFLDAVAERPRRWSDAVAMACGRVAAQQPDASFDELVLKRDVLWLWKTGGLQPGFPELPHPGFD